MATFDWLLIGPPCFYSEGPSDLNWQSHGQGMKTTERFLSGRFYVL